MTENLIPLILAGGKGQRLKSISKGIPKPLMEIDGKHFIFFIFEKLRRVGFKKIYISVGYKHHYFKKILGNKYKDLSLSFINETLPLGTGGAVKNAFKVINKNRLLIFNGDSFSTFYLKRFLNYYKKEMNILMLTYKKNNSLRYGNVEVGQNNKVISFSEKSGERKIINAGVYILKKKIFEKISSDRFSLEEKVFKNTKKYFYHYLTSGKFMDIGTPESFRFAKKNLKKWF